jgi:hypothetical protein
MTITVNDVRELTQLLALHPEWRAEVRRLVLTDELLTLPQLVRDLAAEQQRTAAAIRELTEAQKRAEARLDYLTEAQIRTEARLERLETRVQRLEDRVGDWVGRELERRYRERIGAFLGHWLWPVTVVSLDDMRETLEARLSESQVEEVMLLDLLVRGRARRLPDKPEVWLAMEVSAVIDSGDVERAWQRAALLKEAGYSAFPAVGGEQLTLGAVDLLKEAPAIVLQDGRSQGWEQVLLDEGHT